MKREYYNRDKAFIGAAIGAVGGIVGGLFGRKKRKKQAEAQRQAEMINYQNQQNAINTQYQNTQNAIDAQYEQNVLNVKAQEELNRQQNELAAKKTGIENAAGLTALYANQSELNKEFRNRFMKCGGKRKVRKCGGRTKAACGTKVSSKGRTKAGLGTFINSSAGQILGNAIGGVSSGIGSIFANTGPTYTPTSKVLKYRTNTYKTYKPAELEVYDGITDKFNARKVGENTGTYVNAQSNVNNITAMNTLGQNPTAAITATTQLQSPRYVCGGGKKVRKLKRR